MHQLEHPDRFTWGEDPVHHLPQEFSCRQTDLGCIAGNICMEHEDVVAGSDAFKQA